KGTLATLPTPREHKRQSKVNCEGKQAFRSQPGVLAHGGEAVRNNGTGGEKRIVVTGIGIVTSIGIGRERFWNNLLEGRSGISLVESHDTSRFSVHNGAEVKGFAAEEYVARLDFTRIGRASQFAIAAARLAL